jgi:Tat protein translocase TatB subunit
MGLGAGELILILVIAYVVVGPEDMGKLARTLGKTVHQLRKLSSDLRAEAGKELELPSIPDLAVDFGETGKASGKPVKEAGAEAVIKDAVGSAESDLDSVLREIRNWEKQV